MSLVQNLVSLCLAFFQTTRPAPPETCPPRRILPIKPASGRQGSRQALHVQRLHLLPGPLCFPQKFEAAADAGVVVKAVDAHTSVHLLPSIVCNKVFQYSLQGYTVQWVVLLCLSHGCYLYICTLRPA